MNFATPRRTRPRENVVPLINVVFLLLIFFVLAGTLRPPDPNRLQLPTTTSESPAKARHTRPVLALDAAGHVFRDGRSLSPSEIRSLRAPDGLELRADRGVPARVLLPLLEALEEAGVARLELVTQRVR